MKKSLILFSLLAAVVLSACAKDLPLEETVQLPVSEGIVMTVDTETVTPEGASFLLSQNTDLDIQYGEDYTLQQFNGSTWEDVPVIAENYAFHSIAYNLPKDSPKTLEIDWAWLYGSLPAGEYRLVKEFMDFRGTGDFDTYTITAPFIIQ